MSTSPDPASHAESWGLELATGAAWAAGGYSEEKSHAGSEGQQTADRREGGALSLKIALVAHASVTFPAEAGGGGWGLGTLSSSYSC